MVCKVLQFFAMRIFSYKKCSFLVATLFVLGYLGSFDTHGEVYISEFMASNSRTLIDEDKEYSDWIEIYNSGQEGVPLKGWGLSDSENNLFEWTFPDIQISAGARIIVFASGKNRSNPATELHTNFKLAAEGEYLALTGVDGIKRSEFYPSYPPQYPDVSYGESSVTSGDTPIKSKSPLQYYVPLQPEEEMDSHWTSSEFAERFPEQSAKFKDGLNGIGYETGTVQSSSPAVEAALLTSPEGYWRFNETEGYHFANSGTAGSSFNLTVEGEVSLGSEGVRGEKFPGFEEDNLAAQFGPLEAHASSGVPLLNDLSAFTLAGWIRPHSTWANRAGLFGQNDAIEFGILSWGTLHFWSSGGVNINAEVNLEVGEWYHIAVTGDSEFACIYVNGEPVNFSWTGVSNYGYSDYPFTIGARTFDPSSGEFDGDIDEVLFYTKALSSSDVQSLYNAAVNERDVNSYVSSLNPLIWWKMDSLSDNSGSLGNTLSVDLNEVSQIEGPRPSDSFPGFALENQAASFNGINSRIQLSHNSSLNGNEFTICAWVNPSAKNGCSPIFSSRNYNPYNGYILMIDEEGRWCFVLTDTASSQVYVTGSLVEYDKWSLIMGTFDGTTARLYVNGAEIASRTLSGFVPNPGQRQRIGYGSPNGGDYFSGKIDEVFYLDRAMTENESKELYQLALGQTENGNTTYYFNNSIATDVREEVRNVNPSVYIRYPFQAPNGSDLERITLKVKYVDGFVAWLNGYEILCENAPEALAWNSQALSERPSKLGATAIEYDLTPYKDFLFAQTPNILAIQAFNSEVDAPDFLCYVEMETLHIGESTSEWRYFLTPTPGKPNGQGAKDMGPIISDLVSVPALPTQPEAGDPIVIRAKVLKTQTDINSVKLTWRTMFGAANTIDMFDDGEHEDGAYNDGIYGATIPPLSAQPGQMIRWYVTATDIQERESRWPLYYNTFDSEEYFGTMVRDTSVDSSLLPVLHLFVQNTSAMNSGSNTRISAFYNGEFYDNILIRRRGQTTSGFPKKPYKLEFNNDHRFMYGTNTVRVGKVNLMSNYADKTKIHNSLAYEYIAKGGSLGHWCFPIRIQRNGAFFSVAEMLENGNEGWLERVGWDPEGLLLKVYDNISSAYSAEKKTRSSTTESLDRQAYQNFIDALNESNTLANRVTYAYDNINIPQTVSYFATLALISSQDHGHKNFYLYQDCNDTGEWSILPWDIDLSWGRNWIDNGGYFVDTLFTNNVLNFYNSSQQSKSANRLYNLFFNHPDFRIMYLARLRTLVDTYLQNDQMSAGQSPVADSINRYLEIMDPGAGQYTDAALDSAAWSSWGPYRTMHQECQRTIDTYISGRANWMTSIAAQLNGTKVPEATPSNAGVKLHSLDFMAYSKNPAHKYICITNENPYALDISGWEIKSPVTFTFQGGTVIPSGKSIYVTASQSGFRSRTQAPTSGSNLFITGPWKGELTARGGTVLLQDSTGNIVFSEEYQGNPSPMLNHLRVTEIMYNPLPLLPDYPLAEDLEYLELKNVSQNSIFNIKGATFTDGIYYTVTEDLRLMPQSRVIVAKNPVAFKARYGDIPNVLGPYEGSLSNSGEIIRLVDTNNEVILEFEYKDSWQPATDGEGYSLICVNDQADWTTWNSPSQWRCSYAIYGAPGREDTQPANSPRVKVNEVFPRWDSEDGGVIELFNSEESPSDISGWYLTNEYGNPKKHQLPPNTIIDPQGYFLVDGISGFDLKGGEVWLFSADNKGDLTGYIHGFLFGAQEPNITFGRLTTSTGEEHFVAQSQNTLGYLNSGPLIHSVVFEEIMYHPPTETDTDTRDEYVKLVNISPKAMPLFNTETGTGWYFSEGITFQFQEDHIIPPRGAILVVSFNPKTDLNALTGFMTYYGINQWDERVSIVGPYTGKLSNSGETLRLVRPALLAGQAEPAGITVDTITYLDSSPWPGKADGKGEALRRRDIHGYADDPANWSSKAPSPNQPLANVLPEISWAHEGNVLVLTFSGKLYVSSDMENWTPVENTADGTYTVEVTSSRSQYYCVMPEGL